MRKIHVIAAEIFEDWKKPSPAAVPYMVAMRFLSSLDDKYGSDEGRGIVLYFLGNATTWRGEVAKRIKSELKEMLK